MFDSIVETLHRVLLDACPPDRPYRLSDLKGDLLPETVSRYVADVLRAAAAGEIATSRPTELHWIDQDDDAWSIFDRFVSASISNAVCPAEEWADVLREGVRRAVSHALQPREGLVAAVFTDDPIAELEHDAIAERISQYHTGLSFRASVVRALKKGSAGSLDRDGFWSLVNRVHDAITLEYSRKDWRRDLDPLLTLLAVAGMEQSIPVEAASLLADDLGNTVAGATLRSLDASTIGIEQLLDLIAGPEPEPADDDSTESVAPVESEETSSKPSAVPLWQRFQRNLNEPIAASAPTRISRKERLAERTPHPPTTGAEDAPSTREPVSIEGEKSHRPLWQKYRATRAQDAGEVPATEIETQILGMDGARIRDSFVSELFGGDEDSYLDVLGHLKDSGSWSEASRIIAEQVFKRFQVNIYSEEAVAFTNAVEARFRAQGPGD